MAKSASAESGPIADAPAQVVISERHMLAEDFRRYDRRAGRAAP
jgi:hypothetical protein